MHYCIITAYCINSQGLNNDTDTLNGFSDIKEYVSSAKPFMPLIRQHCFDFDC